ncbi:2-C-methyl-D-erythritol 4-phosphate cytidylyltransferase [Flavobacteriaceae bacterium]|nr:2-C-methyl-D-erythritol 4-phosphate cytidylyltransferase [Flavobacteriaceae bacterium]
MKEKIITLITAAGRGSRFGLKYGIPKQYLPLANVPLLRHTILSFLNNQNIDDVICVIHPDDIELYNEATVGIDLLNPVFGGNTRQTSVRNGLEALKEYNPHKVLIHDAARPFVTKRVINGIIEKLQTHPAVIPAIVVEDTIKKYGDNKIEWSIERDNLWRAQTPQAFVFKDILSTHRAFKNMNFTDDAAIDEYAGIPVAIVPGSQNNFKITTEEDYERAKRIIALRIKEVKQEFRSGIGYDIHSFSDLTADEEKKSFITIGGVKIKYKKKIEAHSDGDVLIHAIIDAMLGSIGEGDIGEHFPDNDDRFKNYDSKKMLEKVNFMLRKKGAEINNIDSTIICEKPNLSKYKSKIKKLLAKILSIHPNKINIKAKTNEKLGYLGRGEAIEAQAICNIKIDTLD